MPDFKRLTDLAKALKLTKQTGRSFHVAVVLRKRKPIAIGTNHFGKSNRICQNYKPTRHHGADYRACVHAEVSATSPFRRKSVRGLSLVSIRIDNHNRLAYAQPCPNCLLWLGKMGFDNIYYSTQEGYLKL